MYLTEAGRKVGANWIENWLRDVNDSSKPGLNRLAMKMATGSGKTVVMAMLIAWNALNKQLAKLYDLAFQGFPDSPESEVRASGTTERSNCRARPTAEGHARPRRGSPATGFCSGNDTPSHSD